MISKFLPLAAIVTVIAGCSRSPASVVAPAPQPSPRPVAVTAVDTLTIPLAEIGSVAERVFKEPAAASAEIDGRPVYDIDVRSYETHARVEHYVRLFTRGGVREEFAEWLARGTRYDAMIRAKFREGGIPEDMSYLALVESGYDPNAVSRASAVGMWQFMAPTARGLGLRVDAWVDERRDPVRSTDAAIRHIRWLQKQFGSLYLAAAAYNGGEGRVARGLSQFAAELEGAEGDDRFFALAEQDYLYAETKNYVPQIIATAIIAKAPEKYGITVRARAPLALDSVIVPSATPLAAVAKAAGVPLSEVVALNPQLLRGMTPPTGLSLVNLPEGRGAGFAASLDALPAAERQAFRRTVTKSETLRALAARMDASVGAITTFNAELATITKGKQKGKLRAGQAVRVPIPAVLAAARDVPDPSAERRVAARPVTTAAAPTIVRHTVKRGETLSGIAGRYGTTAAALRSLNKLKSSTIPAGKTIVVRRAVAQADADEDDAPAATAKPKPTKTKSKPAAKPTKSVAKASGKTAKSSAKSSAKSVAKAKPSSKAKPVAKPVAKSKAKPVAKKVASKSTKSAPKKS